MNETEYGKKVFKDGQIAYRNNELEGSNPYQVSDGEYGMWRDGWQHARDEHLGTLRESEIPNVLQPPPQEIIL